MLMLTPLRTSLVITQAHGHVMIMLIEVHKSECVDYFNFEESLMN